MQFIRQNHSYEVPEIVALKSAEASRPYVEWLESYINGPTE
jgi:uncharacterized protein involved in tolerance to divalent cations